MPTSTHPDSTNTVGLITATRELRCGGKRDNGSRCNHYFATSSGRVVSLLQPCPRCKSVNLFHEEAPDADVLRLELAMAQERTELTLAEAMRRMVDAFADFIDTRRQRLVTI